ncbi:MAG: FAD-dependent oxidoreductase [Lachnospiraceae bacterium]|nr:FAD-dependent oxidoreductase [Lachnospiraceae bacterium]
MKSFWEKTVSLPLREPLRGNRRVDVAVIGAGMTGILTAWFLKQKGARVLVLESGRTGLGSTAHTTAKVTSQHGRIYEKLIRRFGPEVAGKYGELQEIALEAYEKLIREKGIDCHWERRPAYVYTRENPARLIREARAAAKLGLPACFTDRTELPFEVAGAVRFERQAQFHPLEFLKSMADEVEVCENTWVRGVQGRQIFTDRGTVIAGQTVMASHYPFQNCPGYFFLREYQKKSCLLALKGAGKMEGMYIGDEGDAYSFRSFQEFLFVGGEGSRTGKNPNGLSKLREAAGTWYPKSRVAAAWVNQDGVTVDGLPYVGRYSKKTPNLYVASGYGKWGMTNAMAAALLLSRELAGESWDYSGVFSPGRRIAPGAFGEWLSHAYESAVGLGTGLFFPKIGRKNAAYSGGKKCSHLGCKLTWNEEEGVYECPCHGSRFDKNGRRLSGPAPK